MKKSWLMILLVFVLVFAGCANAETVEPAPEPAKLSVAVNGYELTYDDIMREGISFHFPQDELSVSENAVAFTMLSGETEHLLFTMYINSDDGDTHTVIRSESGDILPISFVMAPIPEELPEESRQLFELDAKEAVNMLIATLQLHQLPSGQEQGALDDAAVIALADYQLAFSTQNTARLQMLTDGNAAQFVLPLADGRQLPVFTLTCASDAGDIVAMAEDSAGERIPVAFAMFPLPEELSEDEALLFYQAQEMVNDVLSTMQLRKTGGSAA